jgi:hypothetical protein
MRLQAYCVELRDQPVACIVIGRRVDRMGPLVSLDALQAGEGSLVLNSPARPCGGSISAPLSAKAASSSAMIVSPRQESRSSLIDFIPLANASL